MLDYDSRSENNSVWGGSQEWTESSDDELADHDPHILSKIVVNIDSIRLMTLWEDKYEFLICIDPVMVIIDSFEHLGTVDNLKVKLREIQVFDISDEGVKNVNFIEAKKPLTIRRAKKVTEGETEPEESVEADGVSVVVGIVTFTTLKKSFLTV